MDQPGKVANPARGQLNRETTGCVCFHVQEGVGWQELIHGTSDFQKLLRSIGTI